MSISDRAHAEILERMADEARYPGSWEAEMLRKEAVFVREQISKLDDIRAELDEWVTDKRASGQAWAQAANTYEDTHQRIGAYASAIFSAGLITAAEYEIYKAHMGGLTAAQVIQAAAVKREREKLDGAIKHILGAVDKSSRADALGEYNKLDEVRSPDKIRNWVKKLVELKMLNQAYLLGINAGDFIDRLLSLNKMHLPYSENK